MARPIDYIFRQLWDKIILSGTHPIGQILNFDDQRDSKIEELNIFLL